MRPATAGRAVSQQLESDYQMSQERERSRSRSPPSQRLRQVFLTTLSPLLRVQELELTQLAERLKLQEKQEQARVEQHAQHQAQQLALLRELDEAWRQERDRRQQQAAAQQ